MNGSMELEKRLSKGQNVMSLQVPYKFHVLCFFLHITSIIFIEIFKLGGHRNKI